MAQETLRLTTQQRLAALERENVVLRDKLKMLHGMLKQQRQLIAEYITQQVLLADGDGAAASQAESAETVGHFLCQRRFEQLEERLDQFGVFVGESSARRKAV
ncbi:MAG: hypothetical protein JSW27_25940 [Phycisphaerales bacterium]|nr:MAG: hypothetical protein JSW27_25940 [Phycisphaerales bacterium]